MVVFGVYRLSKQMDAGWAGAIATILCATHPLVVLLSATGLVEVLYAGAFILGLSYYVQRPRTLSQFYVACALFALSCTFHYNAWLAVAPVGAAMLLDFIRGKESERSSLFVGLCIIASFPVAWFIWNWLQHGSPLSFLNVHIEESTQEYETWGAAAPSLKFSLYWMKETALQYSPILAGLSVTSIAGLLTAGEKRKPLMLTWSVLFVFVAGLILLFTYGGLSTAYPARHLLLPSLLMAGLSAQAVGSFDSESRPLRKSICGAVARYRHIGKSCLDAASFDCARQNSGSGSRRREPQKRAAPRQGLSRGKKNIAYESTASFC